MTTAKVFWSGRSQAVRLPKEFRIEANEVRISKQGSTIVLEPIVNDWDWVKNLPGPFDEDFVKAVEEARVPWNPADDEIDDFFK